MNTNNEPFNLDACIEQLKQCHPLKECQVKSLCDKVSHHKFYVIIGKRNIQARKQCSTG